MPVIFTNPQFPLQVGASPTNQAFSVQLNYGEMLREVTQWHSGLDHETAGRMINNRYRQVVDRRSWYGLKVRGQIGIPAITNTGTCTVTFGSNIVQGQGTNWTPSLVGLQFRQTFTQPFQTITAVDPSAQRLTLDMPFQGPTFGPGGYYIVQAYLSFGANMKRFEWAVNQLFGWAIEVNVPVQVINAKDTWRMQYGWATTFATRPPTPDGQFQIEVWPTPYPAQTFAFEGWTQPPNMILDSDSPVAWIRSDVVVSGAVADALLWRPKQNQFYDPAIAVSIAAGKEKKYEMDLLEMENADEGLQQQAVTWDYEADAVTDGTGSVWAQMHG